MQGNWLCVVYYIVEVEAIAEVGMAPIPDPCSEIRDPRSVIRVYLNPAHTTFIFESYLLQLLYNIPNF